MAKIQKISKNGLNRIANIADDLADDLGGLIKKNFIAKDAVTDTGRKFLNGLKGSNKEVVEKITKNYNDFMKKGAGSVDDFFNQSILGNATKPSVTADTVRSQRSISNFIRKNRTENFSSFSSAIKNNAPDADLRSMYEKNSYVRSAMGDRDSYNVFKALPQEAKLRLVEEGRNLRINDVGIGDKLLYNKIPQTAAGVGATAWMVSRMSSSKGQMSNEQLYGGRGY